MMNKNAFITALLPRGSKRRKLVRRLIKGREQGIRSGSSISYEEWIRTEEPSKVSDIPMSFKSNPCISIVVPAFNTPDKYLKPLVESVVGQYYKNWELCLVQGGSTDPERADAIRKCAGLDERIKVVDLKENRGIAGNTNAGIEAAAGGYIAFLDHDDTLAPFALAAVVQELNSNPDIELFYSDEDKLSDDGKERSLPFFKPDWSLDLFLGVNYLAHFVVVSRRIIREVKGIREGFDGAQDFDFLLRVLEKKPKIHHIPLISYHWRMADGSTAADINNKSSADDAGRRALQDYIEREGLKAEVLEVPERPTNYRIKYQVTGNPKVSIIIPFKDKIGLLKTLLASIEKRTAYKNYELILVSNNSVEKATHDFLAEAAKKPSVKVLEYNHPFNYSAVNNYGRRYAKGDVLLFLNNDMEVRNEEWLEELVGVAIQPGVGAVGGWLFYPDGKIQHAGVTLGMGGMAGHPFRMLSPGSLTYFGLPDWPRDYLSVTGACLMVGARAFDQVGGFDEKFIICGSDVALCLSLYEAGYRNVFWPFARMTHFESQSVGSYSNIPPGDYDQSLRYYKPYLGGNDPYFNPNLSLESESITLGRKQK